MMAPTEELIERNERKLAALKVLMEDPNDVASLKTLVDTQWEQIEHLRDRLCHWFDRWEEMQARYLSVRRERDEARHDLISFMERQFALEQHLEGHEDEVRLKVRATARMERDRVARALLEIIEFWRLQKEVHEEDFGEAEGSGS